MTAVYTILNTLSLLMVLSWLIGGSLINSFKNKTRKIIQLIKKTESSFCTKTKKRWSDQTCSNIICLCVVLTVFFLFFFALHHTWNIQKVKSFVWRNFMPHKKRKVDCRSVSLFLLSLFLHSSYCRFWDFLFFSPHLSLLFHLYCHTFIPIFGHVQLLSSYALCLIPSVFVPFMRSFFPSVKSEEPLAVPVIYDSLWADAYQVQARLCVLLNDNGEPVALCSAASPLAFWTLQITSSFLIYGRHFGSWEGHEAEFRGVCVCVVGGGSSGFARPVSAFGQMKFRKEPGEEVCFMCICVALKGD